MCKPAAEIEFWQRKEGSCLHRLDPRVKVVALIGFVALVTTLTSLFSLFLGISFLIFLISIARLDTRKVIKRLSWTVAVSGPLVVLLSLVTPGTPWYKLQVGPLVFTFTLEGVRLAVVLLLRLLNALLALCLLTGTTSFSELMLAFRRLYVPSLVVVLVEFTIRYAAVFVQELRRMFLARRARGFRVGRSLLDRATFLTLSQLVGALLLRSLTRSERIYFAMLARGFNGSPVRPEVYPVARLNKEDLLWGGLILAWALILHLLEMGVWEWNKL
ncbi:MAG: cobalt ECF transporter T component CbiQ [Thermanaeromonas sp.]|uniref:cobalt ECF transporter T component CbiQ n=1 Tax=Thermanaeromonas sp. TaxID=2003697 RepID=UPI0024399A00|nr:cobalt ECF transporter T component CbiQ [Thermanaeromonas sp.]MCG0277495.1 cobalt ECF transporter T component CbiQ [Thermanaeromonas sp.]